MSHLLRRFVALGCLVLASVGPFVSAPGAGATPPRAIVPSILLSTDSYLTSIRTFFLCGSVKCKKERTRLLIRAESAMQRLHAQAEVGARARVQHKYRADVSLFVLDVRLLFTSYREYFTTTSTATLSGLVGNIFYLTSDVGADVNVISAVERHRHVAFRLWVEGEAATLVAMQTDAGALQSSTATKSIGILANQLLEGECTQMLRHADGPDSSFNSLLRQFARNQSRVSQSEILFLEGKKAPLTETEVANLNVRMQGEFSRLVKTETALVKRK